MEPVKPATVHTMNQPTASKHWMHDLKLLETISIGANTKQRWKPTNRILQNVQLGRTIQQVGELLIVAFHVRDAEDERMLGYLCNIDWLIDWVGFNVPLNTL